MATRLISALACYGPKTGALRDLLVHVQGLVAAQLGEASGFPSTHSGR
jgi:hypothetical protein